VLCVKGTCHVTKVSSGVTCVVCVRNVLHDEGVVRCDVCCV